MRIQDVPNSYSSKDRLEEAAEWFRATIKLALENNCEMQTQERVRKIAWWSNSFDDFRDQLRRARNKVKNSYDSHKQQVTEELRRSQKVQENCCKEIIECKRMFSSSIENHSGLVLGD